MEQDLHHFLQKYCDPSRPVLLALSGGPDSLALYHLLLKYSSYHPLKLGIAHIDHGWRIESGEEARLLEKMIEKNSLPFHLKKLDPKKLKGNLEAASRKERLQFFAQLCRNYGYQAVMLAHHSDDQAETVLKRMLEGANLAYLCGLRACSVIDGVTLWRPLLKVGKKQLVDWLNLQGLKGFEDQTNDNPQFLRGRFRTRIIPHLCLDFGKDISKSFVRLGAEAGELRDYLDQILEKYSGSIEKGKWGIFLDVSSKCPKYLIEIQYLIRKFCESGNLSLSRSDLRTAALFTMEKAADKKIGPIYFDRGRLFLPHGFAAITQSILPIQPGSFTYGSWRVAVQSEPKESNNGQCGWKAVWDGICEVSLPNRDYFLGPPVLNAGYPRNSPLSKWWTNCKIPAFMRQMVPVIWENNQIKHEFLSGKKVLNKKEGDSWLRITLTRCAIRG